jgi:hypothetical protein
MEMVDLDSLLPSTHPYRGFQAYPPDATKVLAEVSQLKGADALGVERLFRGLLLPKDTRTNHEHSIVFDYLRKTQNLCVVSRA